MQLNRGTSDLSLQSEINITPLVDVVLVLLIIFMVVVPLLLQGYDVDIPGVRRAHALGGPAAGDPEHRAHSLPDPGAAGREGLPGDCRVTLADREMPVTDLPARVAEILGVCRLTSTCCSCSLMTA